MACASGRGGPVSTSESVAPDTTSRPIVHVVVENDITPSEPLTIYLLTTSGERTFLGSVPPRSTVDLAYRGQDLSGERRLAAGGRNDRLRFISQPFNLEAGDVLHWKLPSNALSVGG